MGKRQDLARTESTIMKASRLGIPSEQVTLIRDTIAPQVTEAEFHLFLELSAAYDLNPMAGEIYAARMSGNNGSAGRMVPIIGRNGWLKMARRHDDFISMDGDVVHAMDYFEVTRAGDGTRKVKHVIKQGGVDTNGVFQGRGPIVGAWCEVRRVDRPATFFYAPIEEYKPSAPNSRSPWLKQESVMILKCAQVTALRLTYPVGGVYDEAEMEHIQSQPTGPASVDTDWGPDEDMGVYLRELVDAANEISSGAYLPEKVRLKLEGADDAARQRFADEMAGFIKAKGGTPPEAPPVDAEVVPDGQRAAA